MIIPREVEAKIRYTCDKVSTIEWSGALFYTVEGSYKEDNLVVKCVDFLVMDIGTASYTEFDVSPDIIAYMCSHPKLMDAQIGLIHSHNTMATFFSGTDVDTLLTEGSRRNHFVSLIVNNAGTYTARITRKINVTGTLTSTVTYNTFNEVTESDECVDTYSEEKVEYTNLVIEKEEVVDQFSELGERLSQIKESKKSKVIAPVVTTTSPQTWHSFKEERWPAYDIQLERYNNPKKDKLDDIVTSYAIQLITGAVAVSTTKLDPVKWAKSMVSVFDKRFKTIYSFEAWLDSFLQFLFDELTSEFEAEEAEEVTQSVASGIVEFLETLPKNKYIESIIGSVELWMAF